MKSDGLIDLTWDDIADLINKEFRDEDTPYKECAYRKPFTEVKRFYDAGVFKTEPDDKLQAMDQKIIEMRKEKQHLSDMRTSLNKAIREDQRKESLYEMMKAAMTDAIKPTFKYSPAPIDHSDRDLIVHFTDPHAGLYICNAFNKYDSSILEQRATKYLDEIAEIRTEQHAQDCYLILGGDMISGLIHVNMRLENKEHVIDQVKLISNVVSNFIYELSTMFLNVHVYSSPGNHGRVSPGKEDNAKGENFDALIPYCASLALNHIENVHFHENTLDDGICTFNVRGHQVYGTHGEKDSVSNVVYNMMKLGRKANMPLPDIIYLGHRHTNGLTTVDDVKVIESGCVDGMDNYSVDHRYVGTPEQTVTVVTAKKRVKALYDIQLEVM